MSITAPLRREIEHDTRLLAVRYYHLIDREGFREAADMFTAEGTFIRAGTTMKGPQEVFDGLRQREAGAVIRHLVANLVVEVIGPSRADVRYDLCVYIQKSKAGGGIAGTQPMTYMRDCLDEFHLTDAGWQIGHKVTHPVFWAV